MVPNDYRLLGTMVTVYEKEGGPVSVTRLAAELDLGEDAIRSRLRRLLSYELVTESVDGNGYEPTVTARELLELDVDEDDFVVIEVPDESSTESDPTQNPPGQPSDTSSHEP